MISLNRCTVNFSFLSPTTTFSLPPLSLLIPNSADIQFYLLAHSKTEFMTTDVTQVHSAAQRLHHISIVHSLDQPFTELFHIFFSLHNPPVLPPSSSLWADECEFYFNKKTEAIRGEFPLSPTTASTAYLHLFPCNLLPLLGELSVLLSKAKTSICALGTISSYLFGELSPILSLLSCVFKISLHIGSSPSTYRICCNIAHF